MPITPTIPIPGIVIDKLTYPVKKLLGFAAKNVMEPQGRPTKEVLTDLVKGDNPSFYKKQTVDGGNEIDTFLYGTPYSTENTSNVGPSYDEYLQKNFPTKKHNVKTYNAHFGDTLYIDQNYKRQVLDELEQGKTVGAHAGMYANAPSKIVSKNEEGRPYDAGGHLMQFSYDEDGNVVANMSDIYDFYPKDFKESYSRNTHGAITLGGLYALHYLGTPFIVRQNGIPVRFKEFTPEYKTGLQSKLGNFLANWGDKYDLTIPHHLTDEQIEEIFYGKQSGDEILDFMEQKGYLNPVFKKGGIIKYQNPGSSLLKPWKALEKMNYEAIPDSTFTRDKTGMGSIEYFSADNNNGITYLNGYHKAHPKPGTDVILYDPATNDQQDVRLDALHFMPKDPVYGALYDVYRYNAKEGDVMYNAKRRYAEDASKYGVENIDSFDQYFNNEADGLLRNMFIEGTPEYIKSKRYYPDKTQLEQWNAHLMPYINDIKTYLETGIKPEHIIEPAVVTAYKKGGRIHIKKKNRGKFTEYCGGKVTEECIARGKRSKNPLTRRRANFASVSRKWKHENGGILKALDYANYITKKPAY